MSALTPGVVLGGCRIVAVVGRGGMGIVYRARQLDLDRDVAVKVIAPELVEDAKSRDRFLTEARAASAVEHPHVIPVHGAGVTDGRAYLVMRYVDGDDLRTLVRRAGPLTPAGAAAVVLHLGDALDAIHRAGYVHRDVKPQNILIDADDHVYLSDFGLAKQALATGGPTTSEQWVGTLDYVAPEQIRGQRVDARADVYALGGVLHYALTGHVPYDRPSDHAKLWAHLVDPPPRPSAVRPELPAGFDAVVARAMAKDPAARYPSAGDLGRAARAAAAGERGTAPERTVALGAAAPGGEAVTAISPAADAPTVVSARPRSRPRRALVLAAAILVCAGVAATLWLGRDPARPRAATVASLPAATATPDGPQVGETLRHVGFRPRDVAVAGGAVWVLSIHEPRIARLDPRTGNPRGEQPYIGRGAADMAADRGIVWVAKPVTNRVLGLDARSGDVVRRITTALPPARIAAGPSGLWIVTRVAEDAPAVLLRYDRAGDQEGERYDVPDGIGAIAVGAGSAWISHPDLKRVLRVEPGGTPRLGTWLTHPAAVLVFGAGRLWASVPDAAAVSRIHPRTRQVVTSEVGGRPAGLAVAGGRVFVAGNTSHRVAILDPDRMRRSAQRVKVPANPYAMTAGAGHVWVTGLGANTLTRLDYRAPRR